MGGLVVDLPLALSSKAWVALLLLSVSGWFGQGTAVAAPPSTGKSPPVSATSNAQYAYREIEASYIGLAFVGEPCIDADPNDQVRPYCSQVLPPRMLLYRRDHGRWIMERPYTKTLMMHLYITKQYSGNWNWVWSPTLGLRLAPRSQLMRLAD